MEEESKVPLLILGTDAAARMAIQVAASLDVLVMGILAADTVKMPPEIDDIPVVAAIYTADAESLLGDAYTRVVIAALDIEQRREMAEHAEGRAAQIETLIDAQHTLSPYAIIGQGNIIGAGAMIQAGAVIGNYNLIGCGCSIGIGTEIGDYCTVQDGALLGRDVVIEDEVFIGLGAMVNTGVHVGQGAMIAAGAVVLQNVSPGASVFGNPARSASDKKK
ncbi:MAG: hypothetical protein OHK0039_46250 [Bacteroidia bacterium]